MKQLLLLVLIVASAVSVSAQKNQRNNDRDERYHYKYDKNRRDDMRRNERLDERNKREFQRQVARINNDYDARILSISRNMRMRRNLKARKIDQLERERKIALNECRYRYAMVAKRGNTEYYNRNR